MSPLPMRDMLPFHSPRRNAGTPAEKKPAPPPRASKAHLLRSQAGAFIYWVCKIGSWSYRGALHYFTLDPIADIQKCQHAEDGLPRLLYDFRSRKVEESTFVRNAASISAAAVIGVFSWPSVEQSFWLAKMFWHWSLIASFFSLVSSVQQRLLREFPHDVPTPSALADVYTQKVMRACLSLVLSCNRTDDQGRHKSSLQMIWVWQSPMMLMSYAWLLFFLGYALHILSPIFATLEGDWSRMTIPMASVTAALCLAMFANFLFCGIVTRRRLDKVLRAKVKCSAASS